MYNDEKMMILKMLEEGKIKSDDAAKLLNAIESSGRQEKDGQNNKSKKSNNFDDIPKIKEKIDEWNKDAKNQSTNKDFDKTVDDFSSKVEKWTKNVVQTTGNIADKVADFVESFVDNYSFDIFGRYKTIDNMFEADAQEDMSLSVKGINGYIFVKRSFENKIKIVTRIRIPQNDTLEDTINIINENKQLIFDIKKIGNLSVSHEVFLPNIKFKNIYFETKNAKICIEDVDCDFIDVKTKNAHIDIVSINSENINLVTKNARIQASYINTNDIQLNTANSSIYVKRVKANNLEANTSNSRIILESIKEYSAEKKIKLNLKTSNASIKVNMDDNENRAYRVKASTSNGKVNLLIPDMIQKFDSGLGTRNIDAESKNFDESNRKVYISAQTSNAHIEIVK